jgi:hypothetical protein
MIVIFSGEGPSALGKSATDISPCCGADFIPGPMAALVDNAIEAQFDYSLFAPGMVSAWFIAETVLAQRNDLNVALTNLKTAQQPASK